MSWGPARHRPEGSSSRLLPHAPPTPGQNTMPCAQHWARSTRLTPGRVLQPSEWCLTPRTHAHAHAIVGDGGVSGLQLCSNQMSVFRAEGVTLLFRTRVRCFSRGAFGACGGLRPGCAAAPGSSRGPPALGLLRPPPAPAEPAQGWWELGEHLPGHPSAHLRGQAAS